MWSISILITSKSLKQSTCQNQTPTEPFPLKETSLPAHCLLYSTTPRASTPSSTDIVSMFLLPVICVLKPQPSLNSIPAVTSLRCSSKKGVKLDLHPVSEGDRNRTEREQTHHINHVQAKAIIAIKNLNLSSLRRNCISTLPARHAYALPSANGEGNFTCFKSYPCDFSSSTKSNLGEREEGDSCVERKREREKGDSVSSSLSYSI